MTQKDVFKGGCLAGGLGVGIGILLAPKSGEETREYLTDKVREGREYAESQVGRLRNRVEDLVERGDDAIAATKKQIATAMDVGHEVYRQELRRKTDRSREDLRSRAG